MTTHLAVHTDIPRGKRSEGQWALDGEMANKLDNAQLQDKYFMMRVRFDGGQITPEQLRVVGGVSRDFGRGTQTTAPASTCG